MDDGSQYVVAAYAVVLFALLLYVVVVALRTARIQREAELLARLVERDPPPGRPPDDGAAERPARPLESAER